VPLFATPFIMQFGNIFLSLNVYIRQNKNSIWHDAVWSFSESGSIATVSNITGRMRCRKPFYGILWSTASFFGINEIEWLVRFRILLP
jgi:hypothetical protein